MSERPVEHTHHIIVARPRPCNICALGPDARPEDGEPGAVEEAATLLVQAWDHIHGLLDNIGISRAQMEAFTEDERQSLWGRRIVDAYAFVAAHPGGRLPAPTIRDAVLEEREACASMHASIDNACSHEREHGDPGAGAMGAVLAYRDAIRARPPP